MAWDEVFFKNYAHQNGVLWYAFHTALHSQLVCKGDKHRGRELTN